MKRRDFLRNTAVATACISIAANTELFAQKQEIRKIFLTGGGYDLKTINYLTTLTRKENPKVCFLPTPMGDSEAYISK